MNDERADFYLASSDSYAMAEPRQCWSIKRMATDKRADILLVKIDPPLIGQKYGLGSKDIDQVLLATRYRGDSLFPVKQWPVFVHVARPLIEIPKDRDQLRDDEFESVAWAELYPSEQDARIKAM